MKKNMISNFRDIIYNRHNNQCSQKYADIFPYSIHLKFVEAQGEKFIYLIRENSVINNKNLLSSTVYYKDIVRHALIAHDSIEDARMTYNDLLTLVNQESLNNYKAAKIVSDIVYCVTDEKGKNRKERKNEKYYLELKQNKFAVFVKLADLAANTLFSKLMNTKQYKMYKKEFPNFKEKVYLEEYKEFFDYVENL